MYLFISVVGYLSKQRSSLYTWSGPDSPSNVSLYFFGRVTVKTAFLFIHVRSSLYTWSGPDSPSNVLFISVVGSKQRQIWSVPLYTDGLDGLTVQVMSLFISLFGYQSKQRSSVLYTHGLELTVQVMSLFISMVCDHQKSKRSSLYTWSGPDTPSNVSLYFCGRVPVKQRNVLFMTHMVWS
ncbi:unnamed protein product [Acanthosepion pharaonis]|uniref:Uncharacterized protein n=1 Tax=Acanthosepion pharaonis TaxID=158019 RepID=A0A812DWX9_ACAPH|nr:unnamed protein product [Sepia pharaonis]